ncbi:hypothetical protein C7H19_09985 [Aphanothece hegewaldii CCALA 016]|uniref:Uncharacterized protein n=1 Tax=Aphanothece hegewaldii CCALA 016 TaxID=2107694 RepID=A0A2T1LYL4_9CHRO|nr:hypothetical protein [Aphanothece hegewaldii]PSF37488.1 hypothetical protein C7H19_09985 [Aphanothece hegewaldii CCALA 016]
MKTLLSVVKILISINIATAIVSLLVFALMREQQTKLTDHKQNSSEPSQFYHTELKAKTTAEQQQLETSYEKIAQHEQEIKKLEGELKAYKTKVKDMLLPKDGQQSLKIINNNYPQTAIQSNVSSSSPNSPPLLNQILNSGQRRPLLPTNRPIAPSQPSFKVLESSSKINSPKNVSSIPVSKNSEREKKISTNENSQIQSTLPPFRRGVPSLSTSFNLPSSPQTLQTPRPKLSSGEITPDSRALFTAQTGQKLKDSFITPTQTNNYNDTELKNKTVLMAQQLSKKFYQDYMSNSEFQSQQNHKEHIARANDIVAGLMVADEKGQITYGTQTYKKVQTAIRLLRRGETINDAARRSTLSPSVLNQLIKWGENRPGNLSELSEISQVSPDVN